MVLYREGRGRGHTIYGKLGYISLDLMYTCKFLILGIDLFSHHCNNGSTNNP